ncbi:hypothetical protein DSL72_005163 [Monilinia vaccinii-corymbosi]|uniref:Uncharacterized protein n=1 Tax=Monilinia vaccinii-corymbosi TaxID=61207 RepID=A0A8A3PEV3_9HELO|nr:hypothetical protein DSL72_005163 [Monilinia vaccinii-corymbosi]
MELRDRGNLSTKTRHSANGPGLWTRPAPGTPPTPEPRNRSERNSPSPPPEGKSNRKRQGGNMRPKRNRAAASAMDSTNGAISSQAQLGTGRSHTHTQGEQALEVQNEEMSNARESSQEEASSSADDAHGRRYSFGTHNRNEPTFLDRIRVLPEMRDLPWRAGQSLPPEKSTDSQRVQQRGACMVATRGRIMPKPYSPILGNQDARALRYSNDPRYSNEPSAKRKREDSEKRPSDDENSIFNRFNSPGHYVSPYPPLPSIPRPPLRTPGLKEAQEAELDSLLQAQIAREELDQGNLEDGELSGNGQQARIAPIVMHRPQFYPPNSNRQPSQPRHTIPNGHVHRSSAPAAGSHITERSLIAESSKSTQRQLFTVMSGVQGGLQQLQKELNQLKAVLGWDAEDEEPVNRRQQPSSREDARPGP